MLEYAELQGSGPPGEVSFGCASLVSPLSRLGSNSGVRTLQITHTKKRPHLEALSYVARPERFELPTPRFEAWCSIQLSYGRRREA